MSEFQVDLRGQTAIVTGAGNGIGQAIALAMAQAGAAVAVNDINPDTVDAVTESILAQGGRAIAFHGDVSNRFQTVGLIETTREAFGRVHLYINAAGVFRADPIRTIDAWDWQRQLEVNLTAAFYGTQLISRVMADAGGGVIVHLASTAGHGGTVATGVGYVATKSAVVGLTRQSARELAPHNIRVNAVCVGNVVEPDMPNPEPVNALQRMGTPDEVASVVLFLCSSAAQFITGQALNVDGGELFS